ncbi:hypothetical protein, partial [Methylobacterium nigriterrae]|uniref:hypothetical protein n=1 Tax=Methylobacterium nigriterrae TaxID=3127512 RepID=UPI0030132562
QIARDIIDARLEVLPDGELRSFWQKVAKLYAKFPVGAANAAEAPPRSGQVLDFSRKHRKAA